MTYSSKKTLRLKRSPQRVSNVSLGPQSGRKSRVGSRNTSSKRASFSNAKKSARARRGVVEQVMPDTLTGESATEHAKRVNRLDYHVALQRQAQIKRITIIVVVAVTILCLALVAGVFVYMNSVTEKMSLTDQNTKAALVPETSEKPFYTLVVGEYYEAGKEYLGPELIMLARFDKETDQVTLVSIPYDTQVQLSNGEYRRICESQLIGGDAELIKEVSKLANVSISHIVKSNNEDFVELVDELGGVTLDVAEEVDDPFAGAVYLAPGMQTLNGEAALTFTRATNLTKGEEACAENQSKTILALARHVMNLDQVSLYFALDKIADKIETDYDLRSLTSLVAAFKSIPDENIHSVRVPGSLTTSKGTEARYFIVKDSLWISMREAMDAGEDPARALPEVAAIDPTTFEITVRNGSGVTGGAQQVADLLATSGFKIKEIGNADQYVYDNTLVIYNDTDMTKVANAVVAELGVGRAVASNGFYSFTSNILVVVGKDWKPLT